MRRSPSKRPIFFLLFLASLLVWPLCCIDTIRTCLIKCLSPLGHRLQHVSNEEVLRLEAENHLLRLQIVKLQQVCEQLKYQHQEEPNPHTVCGRVIYRDPTHWTSCCWIDVGQQTNLQLGKEVISKNSPVVVGNALVGVIDFVGTTQSRVRLITDIALKPSVRAVRGYVQDILLTDQLSSILSHIKDRLHLPDSRDKQITLAYLQSLQAQLQTVSPNWLLAKGILHGAGAPLWRGKGHVLRGIGFNYDTADASGPARELRSGQTDPSSSPLPLLKEHDLLVTTGMDGVFPMGLPVAEVTKVFPLREGSYAYEIEAKPIVNNLEALHTVCVLPAIHFDPKQAG